MHAAHVLIEVALAIVLATTLAIVAKALRQPVILGYIAAGVLAGPAQGFGWISPETIEPISELGLILLLFMIGLEIDLKKLRNAGKAVSRKAILEDVWALHEDTDTRAIDNFIVRLRRYLEDDPSKPRLLLTVRSVGYKMAVD